MIREDDKFRAAIDWSDPQTLRAAAASGDAVTAVTAEGAEGAEGAVGAVGAMSRGE